MRFTRRRHDENCATMNTRAHDDVCTCGLSVMRGQQRSLHLCERCGKASASPRTFVAPVSLTGGGLRYRPQLVAVCDDCWEIVREKMA